jgi:uncharacterized repeat protein (TIGR03837 family)
MTAQRWDIFCKVVDNYGDAGVCWRLARQLVAEHGLSVTLWIDVLASLARIAPTLAVDRDEQTIAGVRVRRWPHDRAAVALPEVVVEGFGCELPSRYVEAMADAPRAPVWINLEYLSPEPWVDSAHGLPSPQPRLPLTRYFYFPGFTGNTGGLLRERDLFRERDRSQRSGRTRGAMLRALGVAKPPADALVVTLFCYPNLALPALLDAWAEGDAPIVCLVPDGVATAALDAWTGGDVPHPGQSIKHGPLTVIAIPFVDQDAYDHLLWKSDLNFVRGEDSFVRAQWAARAFVWHIYPQADDVHRVKLDEFLARYRVGLDADTFGTIEAFWHAWTEGDGARAAGAWPAYRASLPAQAAHARGWADRQAAHPDLASALVQFAGDRL